MKISIITATYNSYPNILSVLKNIQSQTYNNIEYIIIDGGSKDGTLREIERCNFLTHFISEPDQGIYDALNKGIQLATGDIIGFLHSDDLLADNKTIEKIDDCFKRKNVDGVYGDLVYVDPKNANKIIRTWKSQSFEPKLLKKGWMPAHPTLFLKRDIYQKHGLFDLKYSIAADYDFILRIFNDSSLKFEYISEVITKMRLGGVSNKSFRNIFKKSKEDLRIMRYHKIGEFKTLFQKNFSKISQLF